jgi:hypothetical protein
LADHQAFGVAIKDARIVERPDGSQARVIIGGSHGHGIGGSIWKKSGANLPGHLPGCQRFQICHANERVVAQSSLVSLLEGKFRELRRRSGAENGGEQELRQDLNRAKRLECVRIPPRSLVVGNRKCPKAKRRKLALQTLRAPERSAPRRSQMDRIIAGQNHRFGSAPFASPNMILCIHDPVCLFS